MGLEEIKEVAETPFPDAANILLQKGNWRILDVKAIQYSRFTDDEKGAINEGGAFYILGRYK